MNWNADGRLTRRRFVAAGLVAFGGIVLPGCGSRPKRVSAGDFAALSRVLTGEKNLPVQHAGAYLKALDAAGLPMSASELVRVAGYDTGDGPRTLSDLKATGWIRSADAQAAAKAVVAAWWSGMVPTRAGNQAVVTYTDALVWRFVHTPSTCEGVTGVWAKPPQKLAA